MRAVPRGLSGARIKETAVAYSQHPSDGPDRSYNHAEMLVNSGGREDGIYLGTLYLGGRGTTVQCGSFTPETALKIAADITEVAEAKIAARPRYTVVETSYGAVITDRLETAITIGSHRAGYVQAAEAAAAALNAAAKAGA